MDHPLIDLINARIAKAEEQGAFDNLAGAGRPLPRDDDPENSVLTRVVKDAGGAPPFVLMARELEKLRAQLRETADRTERRTLMVEMSTLEAKIEISRRDWRK
jgi:hypothetical protein